MNNHAIAPLTEAEFDEKSQALREAVGTACHGYPLPVVLSVLATFLEYAVVKASRDKAGVDEFANFFRQAIRARWRQQQQERLHAASSPN